MEMPEGYKRLERRTKTSGVTLQNADNRYWLELMKEMAEALENYEVFDLKRTCYGKLSIEPGMGEKIFESELYNPAKKVLKKFKEWE